MASTISAGTTTTTALVYTADTSGVLQLQTNGTTTAVTIGTNQYVGIGTTSPSYPLSVNGQIASLTGGVAAYGLTNSDTISNQLYLQNSGATKAANFQIGSSGVLQTWVYGGSSWVNATTIDSSGNFLIGVTTQNSSGGFSLNPGSAPQFFQEGSASTNSNNSQMMYSSGAGAYRFFVGWDGTIHATSTSISAISDATLKTNVKNLETGLAEINKLQPRRFDWINGDGTNVAGFISQEVQTVLPDLVSESLYSHNEDGSDVHKLYLKMGDMIPTVVKAIQELSAQVTALQQKVGA